MIRSLLVVLLLLSIATVSGCSTLKNVGDGLAENETALKVATQYATLKTIENSDSITAEDFLEHVERVRDAVQSDKEVVLSELVDQVRGPIDWDSLSMADRLALDALISEVEQAVMELSGDGGVLTEDQLVRVLTFLDWVEQAAVMAQGYEG